MVIPQILESPEDATSTSSSINGNILFFQFVDYQVMLLIYIFSTMVLTKINIVDDHKEPKQRTVLDIGCGPSISNIISASKWSQNIILADFLDSNRKEVERFWKVNIL